MFVAPAATGANSVVALPAAVPTSVMVTVWVPIVSGAPAAKFVTEATLRFVSPALGASTAVVLPGPVPTVSTVAVSWASPASSVTVCPGPNPATFATRRMRSPAEAAEKRVVLPCRQQASSACACASVIGRSVRAGPEIQSPFHSLPLRYAVSNQVGAAHSGPTDVRTLQKYRVREASAGPA